MTIHSPIAADHLALELEAKLATGVGRIAVIGLGYVGLPLALILAKRGYTVCGLDVDGRKIGAINTGISYLRDIPDGAVSSAVATGRLRAQSDPSALRDADAIFICVPTPFTLQKEPDTSFIADATAQIATHQREGQLVILRSTSFPGTTEEVVRPILERQGFRVGHDVFLAFAPERISPGNTRFTSDQIPVVVGGCDPTSTRLAALLLSKVSKEVVPLSSPAAAEMAKLLENVFRNVNIALVNQLAQLCDRMELNIWEVVAAAATKPYGFMSFEPGLVGGHCIPVDPYYLSWKARQYDFHMDFIELAARVNEEMPFFVVNKLMTVLHDNRETTGREKVVVLGVAFKKDIDDARHSPAIKVMELLKRRKVEFAYHDPYISEIRVDGEVLRSQDLTDELLSTSACVLILTDHSCFDYEMIVRKAHRVFDTRHATRNVSGGQEKISQL